MTRRQASIQPVPKVYYHPRAPHVGAVLAQNLRNALTVEQHRGQKLISKTWARNLETPAVGFHVAGEFIDETDYTAFFTWHADVGQQWTHARAHVCFAINSELAQFARLRLEAIQGATTLFAVAEVQLAPDSAARIPEGSLFEASGGSYAGIVYVALAGLTLPGSVEFRAKAFAANYNTDDPPVLDDAAMRIDAIDLSVEVR